MKADQPVIDSHCHIDLLLEKGGNLKDIYEDAEQNKLVAAIQIAASVESFEYSKKLCHTPGPIDFYYTIGAHPNETHEADTQSGLKFARQNKDDKTFKAIGEIGLDYFYSKEHSKTQLEVFDSYLELAVELQKPVCIHTRDAHEDTVQMLKKVEGQIPVLIHCFTGNREQMDEYLERGAYISFSGIVTFKNALELQEAAKFCPPERMLAETDSPYLAPVPKRGKTNMPGWVRHVATYLETLTENEELPATLYQNTLDFYRI
ncbi:MAG: TatD family hydrolase [Leptospirales bacterium]